MTLLALYINVLMIIKNPNDLFMLVFCVVFPSVRMGVYYCTPSL